MAFSHFHGVTMNNLGYRTFFIGKDIDTVGTAGGIICYIQIIVLLLTILLTEIELHKHFDKNGNLRTGGKNSRGKNDGR